MVTISEPESPSLSVVPVGTAGQPPAATMRW